MFSRFQLLYKGNEPDELLSWVTLSYAGGVMAPEVLPAPARSLLRIAAVVVVVEALAYMTLAILDAADVSSDRLGLGVGAGVLLAAYGAGQLFAAWRVVHGDAWARSPLIVTHLIQLLLAWNLRGGDTTWLAITMAVLAAIVLACLLSPPVNRSMGHRIPVVRD